MLNKMNNIEYIKIEGLLFPKNYYFSFKDPNGGLWANKISTTENIYRMGISALVAMKIDKIKDFKMLNIDNDLSKMQKDEIFYFIKGQHYDINLFAPFKAEIIETNPLLDQHPILTQESVYDEHWLLEVKLDEELNYEKENWIRPENNRFEKFIKLIIRGDVALKERCCPDLLDSGVVRRIEKQK